MRRTAVFLMFSLVVLLGCTENDDEYSSGIITGPDYRWCICCGGYFVSIENNQYRVSWNDLPSNNPLSNWEPKYPLYVKLKWKPKEESCQKDQITISSMLVLNGKISTPK